MAVKKKKVSPSLSRRMAALGRRRWLKIKPKERSEHFSRIAKLSHPKNNPKAQRPVYNGGRPKNKE